MTVQVKQFITRVFEEGNKPAIHGTCLVIQVTIRENILRKVDLPKPCVCQHRGNEEPWRSTKATTSRSPPCPLPWQLGPRTRDGHVIQVQIYGNKGRSTPK